MDKQLTGYLKNVVELEKSLYSQNLAINQVEEERENLGIFYEYRKPDKPVVYSENHFNGLGSLIGCGAMIGGFIGLFMDGFLVGLFIGGALGGIFSLFVTGSSESAENEQRNRQYQAEMDAYEQAVEADKQRLVREIMEKDRLAEILAMMKERRDETAALLRKYYATDMIYPKYRNLIAVCSLYEYFLSGSTDTLKEAYNKYDNEVLLKAIITKLDEVVMQLDAIKQNQYMLYEAVLEGNRISERLVEGSMYQAKLIERSIDYQAIQANYAAQIAAENKFQSQLMLYDSWENSRR